MITQAFYAINLPCLYVTGVSRYGISKNSSTSQQINICSKSTIGRQVQGLKNVQN